MDISLPELTRMSSIGDSDYGSRDNTFSEDKDDIKGICFRSLSKGQFNLTVDLSSIYFSNSTLYLSNESSMMLLYVIEEPEPILSVKAIEDNRLAIVTSGTLFCFDIQVWLENQLQLGGKSRDPLSSVMKGNFSGMDILGANSDSPIVVTIFKRELFSSICLIDWKDGVVIREVPISVIPSDMQNFSEVSCVSADETNQVVMISDVGCKFLIKVDLDTNACNLFCWQTRVPFVFDNLLVLHLGSRVLIFSVKERETTVFICNEIGDNIHNLKLDYPVEFIGDHNKTDIFVGLRDGSVSKLNLLEFI